MGHHMTDAIIKAQAKRIESLTQSESKAQRALDSIWEAMADLYVAFPDLDEAPGDPQDMAKAIIEFLEKRL